MVNYIDLRLECNGRSLRLGMSGAGEKREFGVTKVEGLEASELEISSTDNALVDGATVDGKRIRSRAVHIEATLRDDRNNAVNRQRIIRFFNPKYSGKLTVNHSGTRRVIEYELEGWNFVAKGTVHNRLSIVVDLVCPDPFWKNTDNFGRNMADVSRHIAFPWRVVRQKAVIPDPFKGIALPGQITGYRTLTKKVHLPNDGDVPAGVQVQFIAERGPCLNPVIKLSGSGRFVRVKTAMEQGDVLVVDTRKRHQVIELNGRNVYQRIDRLSDPFELEVGENYLEYGADENYTNLDVRIYYTPLYLGV